MGQLENVPPEQMPEVISAASRLYDADREAKQERKSAVDAAAELDIPAEYMERAAVLVRAQRAQAVIERRTRRYVATGAALVVAAVALTGWFVTHQHPPMPVVFTFSTTSDLTWNPDISSGSKASLTFPLVDGGTVADVHVDHFAPQADGSYFVNLDTHAVPKSMSGYHTCIFTAKSTGSLTHLTLMFENDHERWRSTLLNVGTTWREYDIPLDQMQHQPRSGPTSYQRVDGIGAPSDVGGISFKLGHTFNDPDAHGDLYIGKIEIK